MQLPRSILGLIIDLRRVLNAHDLLLRQLYVREHSVMFDELGLQSTAHDVANNKKMDASKALRVSANVQATFHIVVGADTTLHCCHLAPQVNLRDCHQHLSYLIGFKTLHNTCLARGKISHLR